MTGQRRGTEMSKIIAVVGATGAQGGSVVDALLARGAFRVRALTRRPEAGKAVALEDRGCEVAHADLDDAASLQRAFEGCHGAFIVTNAWEPGAQVDEFEQGKRAVEAARAAGVEHLVWSTLPNCHEISGGKYPVPHFTEKARVDAFVKEAGFPAYTFVEAPMYFQNLVSPAMSPQPQPDGSLGWTFPMSVDARCIHNGDIAELGVLVARVFEHPDEAGGGQYLSVSPGAVSWAEIVATLNARGHNVSYRQMSREEFDALPFPMAKETREMMEFWEAYTYFGPDAEAKIRRAKELVPEGFTSFADWARRNMRPAPASAAMTETVIDRHIAAVQSLDEQALEAGLAEDAVLITPEGYVSGRGRVAAVLSRARQHSKDEHHGAAREVYRSVHEGVGFVISEAEPTVRMAVNVWTVEGGRITSQTSTVYPPHPFMDSVLRAHGVSKGDLHDARTANTKAVVDRHLSTFGDLDAYLENKAEDILFMTPVGVLRGRQQLRRALTSSASLAPEGYGAAVETIYRTHVGNVGYLVYTAEPFVSLGMDTWIVEGDEIVAWAYASHPVLPNLRQWVDSAKTT